MAARIGALVLLVVLSSATSTVVVLGQLGALQESFDLLTGVYVVFNQRLTEAQVQAARIGEQVRRHDQQERLAPEAPRLGPSFVRNFSEGLDERERLIREARQPIDDALRNPGRFGGVEQLGELRAIQASLDELDQLVAVDGVVDTRAVLSDLRTENQVVKLLKLLATQSSRAIVDLQFEVREAQRRTVRLTLGLTLVAVVVGGLAVLGMFVTLRPLRRLSRGVRRLGRGDWSERVDVPRGRDDEVRQLGREFNSMADALEERERRLLRGERLAAAGQLAAQITHEIRNPLSSVALNAELLEDELDTASPEARRLLDRIKGEVDRLTGVTEAYLGFARRPKPELAPVELRRELGTLLDFLSEEHEQAGIWVNHAFPDEPVWVEADAGQLRQAFMNLIRNAREALVGEGDGARPGSPTIGVDVTCKDGRVEVVVSDNGPGIPLPPDKLDQIFEAFYTRKARGTGLGLPIVQQILHDHDGSVRLGQTGPEGTEFVVRIPACADPAAPVVSQATQDPSA